MGAFNNNLLVGKMVCFVLEELEGPLLQCGLYPTVGASYGITQVIITSLEFLRSITLIMHIFHSCWRDGICSARDVWSVRVIHGRL